MKDGVKMGRKPLENGIARKTKIVSYVTPEEGIALSKLASDYPYDSMSDVIRRSLALLIRTKHPELADHLRSDLA